MPMGFTGRLHARPPELLVDDQLRDRVGVEAERRSPVRYDVSRLGELPPAGAGVAPEPIPDLPAVGVVFAREAEVHRGSVGSSSCIFHLDRFWRMGAGVATPWLGWAWT